MCSVSTGTIVPGGLPERELHPSWALKPPTLRYAVGLTKVATVVDPAFCKSVMVVTIEYGWDAVTLSVASPLRSANS
jgi:hypothetical protein